MKTENITNKPVGRAGKSEGGPVRVQLTIPEDLNAMILEWQKAQKDARGAAPDSKSTIILDALRTYFAQLPWTAPDGPPPVLALLILALASGCDRGTLSGFVSMLFAVAACYVIGMFLITFKAGKNDK